MDGETKPRSFMIADLLTNVSPSKPNSPLPIEVHSSDNATGSDVTVNRDVIDGSVQSPTTITSRGTIQDNLCVEPRPNPAWSSPREHFRRWQSRFQFQLDYCSIGFRLARFSRMLKEQMTGWWWILHQLQQLHICHWKLRVVTSLHFTGRTSSTPQVTNVSRHQ